MTSYKIVAERTERTEFYVEAPSLKSALSIFGEYRRSGEIHDALDNTPDISLTVKAPRATSLPENTDEVFECKEQTGSVLIAI